MVNSMDDVKGWIEGAIAGIRQSKALVIVDQPGSGKSLFARRLTSLIKYGPVYYSRGDCGWRFIPWLDARLVIFDDVKVDQEELKSLLEKSEVIQHRRGLDSVVVPHISNYMILTNKFKGVDNSHHFIQCSSGIAQYALGSVVL